MAKLRELSPKQVDEMLQYVEERLEKAEAIENEIKSSDEYICWLRDLLKDRENVDDFDIEYKENVLEKNTYENLCKLSYFYSTITEYWEKYSLSPTYIEDSCDVPVYRVFYEDFYFEICSINCLQGYISVRKAEDKQKAINYKDIMEDKKPEKYEEREEFIKEFYEEIRKVKQKAEELDIDIEYLKEIIENEFEDE